MKRVFLSADDLGRSEDRNSAIIESFKNGWIKSAGLIVTGRCLQDAINQLFACNGGGYLKDVHCHFNLSGNINGDNSNDVPLTLKIMNDKSFCSKGLFNSYTGLPNRPFDVFKWWAVYKELCAQYNRFRLVTLDKGNLSHVDFHLWYNLTWPVSIALNLFTWTHRIKSVRYIGVHLENSRRKIFRILAWNPFVKSFRSSNIDGFLTHPEWFKKDKSFELYCHPDYLDGVLVDNSTSYFGHKKRSMKDHIELLKQYDIEFLSWKDA